MCVYVCVCVCVCVGGLRPFLGDYLTSLGFLKQLPSLKGNDPYLHSSCEVPRFEAESAACLHNAH